MLAEIKNDLKEAGTVVDLIKSYSDALRQELDTGSPIFTKLHTLFNAGIGPVTMDGFYRGALVSWQSRGLLALARLNSINVAWEAARLFSPWTGKKFEPIDREKLSALTHGWEKGDVPTFFCSNTVVFRTAKERFARAASQALHVWMEDAAPEEKRLYGYDANTFFFFGKRAPSVYPNNEGKQVFQFNYRWEPLKNPIPDKFCIDELVQIAERFYLGQVFYAVRPSLTHRWSSDAPSKVAFTSAPASTRACADAVAAPAGCTPAHSAATPRSACTRSAGSRCRSCAAAGRAAGPGRSSELAAGAAPGERNEHEGPPHGLEVSQAIAPMSRPPGTHGRTHPTPARSVPRPLVVFLDEIGVLQDSALITALRRRRPRLC